MLSSSRCLRPIVTRWNFRSLCSVAKQPIPPALLSSTKVTAEAYAETYARSVGSDGDAFWAAEARKRLTWSKDFTVVRDTQLDVREGPVKIAWFPDGELNVSANCIDRHVAAGRGGDAAILWEGDDAAETRRVSYDELLESVSRLANALRDLGVKKGDRVSICLPMIPEVTFHSHDRYAVYVVAPPCVVRFRCPRWAFRCAR